MHTLADVTTDWDMLVCVNVCVFVVSPCVHVHVCVCVCVLCGCAGTYVRYREGGSEGSVLQSTLKPLEF